MMNILKKNTKATASPKKAKKISDNQAVNDYLKEARGFEKSRIEFIEKSKVFWQWIALGACGIAIANGIAIVGLTPLKEKVPFVLRVNNNTGEVDFVTSLKDEEITSLEETARYYSANYVKLSEGYDWYTVQKQFDDLMLFSDSNMQNAVKNKYANVSSARHKVYGQNQRVDIKINSVAKIGDKLEQIRFTKTVAPMNGGNYDPATNTSNPAPVVTQHIATLAYDYVNVPTVDEIKLVNPFGFTVKSYQVNDDGAK